MTEPGVAIVLRLGLYLALGLLFGLPLFALAGRRGGDGTDAAFATRGRIAITATAGLVLSVAAFLASVAAMAALPVASLDRELLRGLILDTAIGRAFLTRIGALLAALAAGLLPRVPAAARRIIAVLAGGVALASLAWTGHGAMDEGAAGWAHLIADIVHLLAAGLWIGALAALLALVMRDLSAGDDRRRAVRALHGFSAIGTAMVAMLTVSGGVNVWALLIRPGTGLWPLDDYRRLLVLKLAAFLAMLALAGANRWVLTRRLAEGGRGIRASIAIEAALGVLVLALVARMGMLSPAG